MKQMCVNGSVRNDERRLGCLRASAMKAYMLSQLKVMSRQVSLADITRLVFAQQQMDCTW